MTERPDLNILDEEARKALFCGRNDYEFWRNTTQLITEVACQRVRREIRAQ